MIYVESYKFGAYIVRKFQSQKQAEEFIGKTDEKNPRIIKKEDIQKH